MLSKSAGLAGLRIGWLATRRADILDAVATVKDYNSICSSAPSEFLAGVAVRQFDRLVARSRGIVAANLATLKGFFARRGGALNWTAPEGGSIGFPNFAGGRDAEAISRRLVAEAGVMILPGSCYSAEPSSFRLGFGRANMPEALAAFEAWLDRNPT